ncbi:MBL fold metallo-hydrolase [Patulibacter sp. S7RM1-6]
MAVRAVIEEQGAVGIAVPTPFLVGAVNAYLLEDEPLTLVDTGPNTADALLVLEAALVERGHRLADVGRIVVTHQHFDHAGLVGPLVARTGAEVVAIAGFDAWLAGGRRSALADERYARDLMRHHGTSEDVVDGYWAVRPDTVGFSSGAPAVRTVRDGDELSFAGRTLRVHHRPGHSPSDTVLEDAERGVLLVGDHLLAGQDPVPVAAAPQDGAPADVRRRRSAFLDHRASLRRTARMDAAVALAGHGAPIDDPAALAARRLAEHDVAAERLEVELRDGGPGSARELVLRTVARRRPHPFFALCTTLGTLDQLVDEGRATVTDDGGTPRYAAIA